MNEKYYIVKILPLDKEIKINEETNLRDALQQAGIKIKSICGGFARCGMCKVKIVEGQEYLSEMKLAENNLLGNIFHITKERLACQLYVTGNITITIP